MVGLSNNVCVMEILNTSSCFTKVTEVDKEDTAGCERMLILCVVWGYEKTKKVPTCQRSLQGTSSRAECLGLVDFVTLLRWTQVKLTLMASFNC